MMGLSISISNFIGDIRDGVFILAENNDFIITESGDSVVIE
mgnify:CR=1 FL=1